MKVVNDSSMPGIYSERQVLCPTAREELLPETMEEIKIRIINDRATGSKRERDEVTLLTPCAKRSRPDAFTCSTPSSSSARTLATQHPLFPALDSENSGGEELDDSLLDPLEDEDDSELCLTSEQEDTLLRDDNDPCYADEPPEKYNEMTRVVTFRPSENEGENDGASLYKTLDVWDVSNTLTREPESEGDLNNYAAMPPSPCQSALDRVEVIEPIQSSVCNVKSPKELPTSKTVLDLSTPLLGMKEVSSSETHNSFSPKRLPQTSISLLGVTSALTCREDLYFAFDEDIDNLLPLSPVVPSSSNKGNGVGLAAISNNGKSSGISDSTLRPQVLKAKAASCSNSDAALPLNTAGLSKDPHSHHAAGSKPSKVPSTTSSVASVKPKLNIMSLRTGKTAECEKPSEESESVQNKPSASSTNPPNQGAAPTANNNQSKIAAPSCNVQDSTEPNKKKPRIAITPVCRPSFRAFLSEFELEKNKEIYCNHVLMHINSQGAFTFEGIILGLERSHLNVSP
ncbi:S100P-binding protein isoform 2-T4 [Anomaloglossus baeobatrachus]|uniref:S100P-binding protein isoform X2 n=1 Tax=Anomaloglossus baeobatrachus TaxID=238106 RepID=UPI003F50AF22